jgi:putative tricarboxylic transport membrane protein
VVAHPERQGLPERGKQDYYGGALMILIGLFASVQGVGYGVGSVQNMGPGFFPVSVGVVLIVTGLGIAIIKSSAKIVTTGVTAEWRGWTCILASLVAFICLAGHLGLLPATFATVFIAALGDRENTLLRAAVLAAGVSLICVIVFWWGIQVQIPLFDWS